MVVLLGAVATVACGRAAEARTVITPAGHQGFAIRCKHAIDCMDLAGKACPSGYVTVDRESETEGTAFAGANKGTGVGYAKVESTGTLLIECRDEPWPDCSAPHERRRACSAARGRCEAWAGGGSRCLLDR